MSYASAFNGLTYTTRVPAPSAAPSAVSRSSAQRNAASVLPEPVGAETSTCSPPAMAGHAWTWAGVGAAKACSNQRLVRGVKLDRGTHASVAPGAGRREHRRPVRGRRRPQSPAPEGWRLVHAGASSRGRDEAPVNCPSRTTMAAARAGECNATRTNLCPGATALNACFSPGREAGRAIGIGHRGPRHGQIDLEVDGRASGRDHCTRLGHPPR